MLGWLLYRAGVRGWHLHMLSLVFVVYCLGLWIRAKTVDQSQRGHAERRALYVGLWPPMFWVIGDAIERYKRRGRDRLRRGAKRWQRRTP